MIFGVCAGIAEYFGFDVTVTRVIVAVVAFFAFPDHLYRLPVPRLAAAVARLFGAGAQCTNDPVERQVRSSPHDTLASVRYRFRDLDVRLQRLEKYVTSNRYKLEREFREARRVGFLRSCLRCAREVTTDARPFEFALGDGRARPDFQADQDWQSFTRSAAPRRDDPVNAELLERLDQVEERVRVLERIVTDERYELSSSSRISAPETSAAPRGRRARRNDAQQSVGGGGRIRGPVGLAADR